MQLKVVREGCEGLENKLKENGESCSRFLCMRRSRTHKASTLMHQVAGERPIQLGEVVVMWLVCRLKIWNMELSEVVEYEELTAGSKHLL